MFVPFPLGQRRGFLGPFLTFAGFWILGGWRGAGVGGIGLRALGEVVHECAVALERLAVGRDGVGAVCARARREHGVRGG